MADGLQALWDAGMVHRDVKPGNILLDLAGKAYITDFGLAKDSQGTALTRPGQALGSMDYMPPEQIRGEPVTGASDIYSLGCVVFECVLGQAAVRRSRRGCGCCGRISRTSRPIHPPRRPDIPPAVRAGAEGRAAQGARRATPHQRRVRALALGGRGPPDRGRAS